MSLATRCTACGTIFRVVQDQLRVSEGWVRCGRCAEVFDAREQLFDLDREAPPPWPPAGPESPVDTPAAPAFAPPPPVPAPRASTPATPARPPVSTPSPAPTSRSPARQPAPAPLPSAATTPLAGDEGQPQAPAWSSDRPGDRREPFWEPAPAPLDALAPAEVPDAREDLPEPKGMRFEASEPPEPLAAPAARAPAQAEPAPALSPDLGPDVVLAPSLRSAQTQAQAMQEPAGGPASATTPARKPGFLRRAEGEARWQRPGVRMALGLGSLLLFLCAAAQLTWHYRDALATQSPLAHQWLGGACEKLGCTLQPWRRLDAFSVESTGLSEAASGNHYRFSLNLRNKSPWELATPWVELSLNDGNGKVLMKKALKPEDFVNGRDSTAANSEQALQLVFSTGRQRVNGYTVEIFYP